jgi:hypothetical protein
MKDGRDLINALAGYTGSDEIYRHSLVASFNYTEGVRKFAIEAGNGAYWLLDILATEPVITRFVRQEGFALVLLKITGSKATLTVDDGNGSAPVFTQEIKYTDCPECPVSRSNTAGAWKFYIESTYASGMPIRLCMLPQER